MKEDVFVIELVRDEAGKSRLLYSSSACRILKEAKVKIAAYRGELNEWLTQEELWIAKKEGKLPSRLNLHHIIPLCCKNTSLEPHNLSIIEKQCHIWIHKHIYDPLITRMQAGERTVIAYPKKDSVITFNDLKNPCFLKRACDRIRE